MLLYSSEWLTCHHEHLSNLQLGCEEPKKHENANKKRRHENKNKKAAEEAEKEAKEEKKLREKPREL